MMWGILLYSWPVNVSFPGSAAGPAVAAGSGWACVSFISCPGNRNCWYVPYPYQAGSKAFSQTCKSYSDLFWFLASLTSLLLDNILEMFGSHLSPFFTPFFSWWSYLTLGALPESLRWCDPSRQKQFALLFFNGKHAQGKYTFSQACKMIILLVNNSCCMRI